MTLNISIKPKYPTWVIYIGVVILHLPTIWFLSFDIVEGL